MGGAVEAMSASPEGTVDFFTKQNLFAKAVHAAFFGHHPLILSPDVVWLTIAQGLANHVDQNAEKLRDKFVSFEGKKELTVTRDEFVKGSPTNDWEGVFPEFTAQIAANTLPGTVDLIGCDFSTTGPAERVVSHITVMDAVQHYFTYTMACGCGFPRISLAGTAADWELVRAKAAKLRAFELDWWLKALLPALDQFVEAAHGRPDLRFWRALVNINVGTSMPRYEPLTGWIQVFFPYLNARGYGGGGADAYSEAKGGVAKKQLVKNTELENYVESITKGVNVGNFGKETKAGEKGTKSGINLDLFPPAMSSAPFTYNDFSTGRSHSMAFVGGVSCLVQHPDGTLEPKVGWAVMDSGIYKLLR